MRMISATRRLFPVLLALALAACAGARLHSDGLSLLGAGKIEEGLAALEQAVKEEPTNAQYRAELRARREEQVNRLLAAAASSRAAGQWDAAEAAYRRVLRLEADNTRAEEGLRSVVRDRRHAAALAEAKAAFKQGDLARVQASLRLIQAENPANPAFLELKRRVDEQEVKAMFAPPTLKPANDQPVSLRFAEANLKMVFDALARGSGVNIVLDKDVRPDLRTSINVSHVAVEDAIDLLLETNRLEKKVLNANTVLIYPNTPEKVKEYQELMVKGFYLNNADVKQTQAMVKGLLKARETYIDEKLNLLIMRDTPEAIRLAEKLIAMQDLYEPEAMLEVEVLEVQRSRLTELGIKWPEQLTLTPIVKTLADLHSLTAAEVGAAVTPLMLNFRREVTDANILANPRIRVRNREKAKILIGDKVPVVTTTVASTGFASANVQYLDVGLKLEVEPNIYLQDDVAIKVALEVSSIVKEIPSNGVLTYQIGTRNATTVLRLKDGETQVLAGLISDEDRTAANRVPGLGDLPIAGRLFSSQKDDRHKTEIVLSITPHLVRNINRPDALDGQFWSGTESFLRTRPLALKTASAKTGSASESAPAAATSGLGAPAADVAPSQVALAWQGPASVKVGEKFKVTLRVKTDGGLRGMPLQAAIDPEVFEVVAVSEGGFFRQNEAQTSFSSNVDASAGKIFVGIARSGIDGVRGEDSVIELTLKAKAAKPRASIRVLSATPLAVGGKLVTPTLPDPLLIPVAD